MGNDRKFLKKKITEARGNYGHQGPFWYFTLHGLGPGTLPKDINVVDSVEGVNKKGTKGLFIALDGVLTWDELKKYDLIELAPPKAMQECRESLKESNGMKYLFTFDDNTEIAAHDEEGAMEKYERLWKGRERKEARPFDELDKIAYDLYRNRDDEGFYDFNDEELAQLWARGSDVAYDDEVYETIRCLPHFKDIFRRADQIANTLGESLNKKPLTEAKEDDFYFRAFITNLGKYNEGYLIGEWVDFPIDEDKFNEILKKNGIGEGEYEEWFVTDYESDLPGFDWHELGEYANYNELQEFGEKIEEINKSGQGKAIANAYEATGDIQQAIDGVLDGDIAFYEGIFGDYDLGVMIIDDIFGGELSDDLIEQYFDFEALGRDIRLDYYPDDDMPETAGEYWAGDENATDYDIGEAAVDDLGINGINNKDYYFDFEAFGRDAFYDNFVQTSDGVVELM